MITPSDILAGKILIVDDMEANVLLLERMLRAAGYGKQGTLHSTFRADEVCELHLTHRFDLILLDLEMPGMNGFQVMENLKEIETDGYLPVLVITAQPAHKMRALKAGAKDFVSKPFDLAEVLVRVHNMLEVRLLHVETKRLYDRVVAEQELAQRLARNLLPTSIVDRLSHRTTPDLDGTVELVGESYAEITVLFADILEFTRFAEGASADVLVGVLDDIAGRLAGVGQSGGARDLHTMEDAYLATVGLPDSVANRSIDAAHKALDLVKALDRFNQHSRYQLCVRIGLDVSAEEAGVRRGRTLRYELG